MELPFFSFMDSFTQDKGFHIYVNNNRIIVLLGALLLILDNLTEFSRVISKK